MILISSIVHNNYVGYIILYCVATQSTCALKLHYGDCPIIGTECSPTYICIRMYMLFN